MIVDKIVIGGSKRWHQWFIDEIMQTGGIFNEAALSTRAQELVDACQSTSDTMDAWEFGYRLHCRAMMSRIRNGEDLAPPTDVELLCAFDGHTLTKINHKAFFYHLAFRVVGNLNAVNDPQKFAILRHYEEHHRDQLNRMEANLRSRLTMPARRRKSQ